MQASKVNGEQFGLVADAQGGGALSPYAYGEISPRNFRQPKY